MTRLSFRAAMLMGAAAAAVACKPTWQRPSQVGLAGRVDASVVPQRVDGGEGATPVAFEVDARTGRVRGGLVLRLDYFPTAGGEDALPRCLEPLPADTDVGVVRCEAGDSAPKPVLAKNLDQDCYTDGKDGRVVASEPITLPGCTRGLLVVHRFEPALKADAETKDVN